VRPQKSQAPRKSRAKTSHKFERGYASSRRHFTASLLPTHGKQHHVTPKRFSEGLTKFGVLYRCRMAARGQKVRIPGPNRKPSFSQKAHLVEKLRSGLRSPELIFNFSPLPTPIAPGSAAVKESGNPDLSFILNARSLLVVASSVRRVAPPPTPAVSIGPSDTRERDTVEMRVEAAGDRIAPRLGWGSDARREASKGCMEHANYMRRNQRLRAMVGSKANRQRPNLRGEEAAELRAAWPRLIFSASRISKSPSTGGWRALPPPDDPPGLARAVGVRLRQASRRLVHGLTAVVESNAVRCHWERPG